MPGFHAGPFFRYYSTAGIALPPIKDLLQTPLIPRAYKGTKETRI